MDAKRKKSTSKFLSLVLRHQPQTAGLELDKAGWVGVDELLDGLRSQGRPISREELDEVVTTNDKQRFQFSPDRTRIRATQGHSVSVDLGHKTAVPPDVLFHGTPEKFVDAILQEGLKKMKRHHVHLHRDRELARTVGQRRGKSVVLSVNAKAMSAAGHAFFVTPNKVWLTDRVPPEFIDVGSRK